MKKLEIIALLIAAAGLSSACGSKRNMSRVESLSKENVSVILLTEGSGIDDKSFYESAWRGITRFYDDTPSQPTHEGKYYKYIFAPSQDAQLFTAKLAADERPDLVLAAGFSYTSAIEQAARDYPNQKFALIDTEATGANIYSAEFGEHEGSYLVGVAAALRAEADKIVDPKFGFVGGIPGAVITRFEMGYVQGVLSVLPDATIVDYYANDWGRPDLGKTQAKSWYDSGVYAIFSAASDTGNGVIAQAKEYRLQGKNVWAIGVDTDQYEDGIYAPGRSAVLTSMIKRVDVAAEDILRMVKNDSFRGGVGIYNLSEGGVDFSTKNSALTSDITERLRRTKADIIAGKTPVYRGYAEAKSHNAAPVGLNAKDD